MDKQWCHHQWKGVSLVAVRGWGLRHRLRVHCRCVVVGPPRRCLRAWRCRRCVAWLYRRRAVCSWLRRHTVSLLCRRAPCPGHVIVPHEAASSLSSCVSLSSSRVLLVCVVVASSLSLRVVLACPGCIIVVSCRRIVVPHGWSILVLCVSWWVERNGGRGHSPLCPNNNERRQTCRRSSFGCHVANGDVGPGHGISDVYGGEVSCLTSARHRLGRFVGAGHRW